MKTYKDYFVYRDMDEYVRGQKMKILICLSIVLLLTITGTWGCGTNTTTGTQRSPLEQAKLAYVDASIAYEATMNALVDLRSAHRITDAQWVQIDNLQTQVIRTTPLIKAGLRTWAATGQEPATYEINRNDMLTAVTALQSALAQAEAH